MDNITYQKAYYLKNRERILSRQRLKYREEPQLKLLRNKLSRSKHRVAVNSQQQSWRRRNPEKWSQIRRRYLAKHPEIVKARCLEWRENNREKHRQMARDWRKKNPSTVLLYGFEKRSKMYLSSDPAERVKIESFVNQTKSRPLLFCFYCRRVMSGRDVHFDHMTPISRGGSHVLSNLCAACPDCNLSKHMKTALEFEGFLYKRLSDCGASL